MTNSAAVLQNEAIDTDLYSRQIGAFGLETMGKLIRLRVLISGLTGVGVEVAKNLALAGPKAIALHDERPAKVQDLAANFYMTEDDAARGISRARACAPRLAELNSYVHTFVLEGPLTPETIHQFDVVVVSDMDLEEMLRINDICRNKQPAVGFIVADGFGAAGCVFVDFGPEFTVVDPIGEPPLTAIIEGITQDNPGTVNVHQDKVCKFATGDYVVFREVEGMTELNQCDPMRVTRTGKYCFTIEDTSGFSPYTRNGIVEEVKMPKKLTFMPLRECLLRPLADGEAALLSPDLAKFGRTEQLHLAIQSLYAYRHKHGGSLPSREDPAAVAECLQLAADLNKAAESLQPLCGWKSVFVNEIDESVVRAAALFAECRISPLAAFLGGVAAQEVVKITGKFTPIHQWLYYDAFEALPSSYTDPSCSDTAFRNCRYDHQIAVWGREFQRRLGKLRIFLIGAGALGCELLKSFALMGCCTSSEGGELTVTDMDRIEVSNLNRQFLFRRHHVGSSKSRVAAEAAHEMNPDCAIKALETRVGLETENVFSDDFWMAQDVIVNALDNIASRLYIDGRCVWYHKPLLESGTLGTKANSQVIVPNMTQSYGDSQDPPEESIPLCTLKHFPNQIEHTIEWSRDAFEGLFCDGPREAAAFLVHMEEFLGRLSREGTVASQKDRLLRVQTLLSSAASGPTFEKCIAWAVDLFVSYFDHQIAQLLHKFPLDYVTSSGMPFWSGPKRPPQILRFDPQDPLHMAFVFSAANLLAFNLGIARQSVRCRDFEVVRATAAAVPISTFVPKDVRIKVDDTDATVEGAADDEIVCARLINEVRLLGAQLKSKQLVNKITPIEFEKDDDTNFHIDFIYACSNLRARNYRIVECDRHKAKMIAGKIVPAIATTTAMITGLVSIELLKVIAYGERKREDFKNAYINLSTCDFVLTEPAPPVQTKDKEYDPIVGGPVRARPNGFTPWDIMELHLPNASLGDVLRTIEEKENVDVTILSVGTACLYNSFLPKHAERLDKNLKELTETVTKIPLPSGRRYVALEASCSDKEGVSKEQKQQKTLHKKRGRPQARTICNALIALN